MDDWLVEAQRFFGIFYPDPWGRSTNPIWLSYFSIGWFNRQLDNFEVAFNPTKKRGTVCLGLHFPLPRLDLPSSGLTSPRTVWVWCLLKQERLTIFFPKSNFFSLPIYLPSDPMLKIWWSLENLMHSLPSPEMYPFPPQPFGKGVMRRRFGAIVSNVAWWWSLWGRFLGVGQRAGVIFSFHSCWRFPKMDWGSWIEIFGSLTWYWCN